MRGWNIQGIATNPYVGFVIVLKMIHNSSIKTGTFYAIPRSLDKGFTDNVLLMLSNLRYSSLGLPYLHANLTQFLDDEFHLIHIHI